MVENKWGTMSWSQMAKTILDANDWGQVEDMVDYIIWFNDLDIDFESDHWEDDVYAWCYSHA